MHPAFSVPLVLWILGKQGVKDYREQMANRDSEVFYFLTEIPLSSTSTYPICYCRYDQSIWHKKGSFGFLQKCHWQHRYTNLKQNQHSVWIPILAYKSASRLRGQPSYWDKPDLQHSTFKDVSTAFLISIISREIRNSNILKAHLTTFTSAFIKC